MLSKLSLLVLTIIMALVMACSDDGSNGEPDSALIDNHFAPFSLLADSCELISIDAMVFC